MSECVYWNGVTGSCDIGNQSCEDCTEWMWIRDE